MLRWRLLLSALFVPTLLLVVYLEDRVFTRGCLLIPLALLLANLAAQEMLGLYQSAGLRASRWVVHTGTTIVLLSAALPHWFPGLSNPTFGTSEWSAMGLALSIGLAFGDGIGRYREATESLLRFALATVVIAYVGFLFTFPVHLLWVGQGDAADGTRGLFALGSLILIVKMGDVGAYTVGRLVGRTKLAPQISPGKTLEGFFGGMAFAWFAAWFCWNLLGPWWLSVPAGGIAWTWSLYALVANAAGTLGDLAESLLKRSVGRKDSSLWMPGFGGVLDLVDSILMAGPVAFLFWGLGWIRL